jgi:outer membrane protein OmpA-like peptidoglycan-associated protein
MHPTSNGSLLGASGQDKVRLTVRKEENMRHGVRMSVVIPAVLLLVSGCATRDWVRGYVAPKEADLDQRIVTAEGKVGEEARRLDQRITATEGRVTEGTRRIGVMDGRMNTLETSIGEVREGANVARERADTAMTKADETNSRLTRLWDSRNNWSLVETIEVPFRVNRWDLSDKSETALVGLVSELKANHKLAVVLEGYTDPSGGAEYNLQLSQRRVEAVRRFLAKQGVELPRIHAVGLGPILDPATPKEKKRRVTVKLTLAE